MNFNGKLGATGSLISFGKHKPWETKSLRNEDISFNPCGRHWRYTPITDEMLRLGSYTHTWWLVNNEHIQLAIMHRLQNAQIDAHITQSHVLVSPPVPVCWVKTAWDGWMGGSEGQQRYSHAATDNVISATSANTCSKRNANSTNWVLSERW